jgi:L-gulonate 5-dehydrogenase
MIKMKAAVFDAPRQVSIREWDTPTPQAGDVLVRVKAAGICAGDTYIYQGKNPYAEYPVIGGHEIAGIIERLGAEVDGLTVGQLVVIEPFLSCGQCYPCRVGKPNCCVNLRIIGVHRPGGYADFVVAPASHIHIVPEGVSPTTAVFAEPLTIGLHACERAAISDGEMVVVLGAGPIGLAIIEAVRVRGGFPVAVDVLASRLAVAAKLGAEVLEADDHLLSRILERTNGEGAAVVIEATGNSKAMESTVELIAAGGRIVIVGLLPKGKMIQLSGLDLTRKEMTILGSRTEIDCFPEALRLLASGEVRYPRFASEFDLWNAGPVFAEITAGNSTVHKGVFVHD